MSDFSDPFEALLDFEQAIKQGMPCKPCKLNTDYIMTYDKMTGMPRYCFAKVVDGRFLTFSSFGMERPIGGFPTFSVNYAVRPSHQGKGLAVETVNLGIEELKNGFRPSPISKFYVEAIVDETNIRSIKVAEKIFPGTTRKLNDDVTGAPCLHFMKLVVIL